MRPGQQRPGNSAHMGEGKARTLPFNEAGATTPRKQTCACVGPTVGTTLQ